jgi:hypothetical protein
VPDHTVRPHRRGSGNSWSLSLPESIVQTLIHGKDNPDLIKEYSFKPKIVKGGIFYQFESKGQFRR